MNRSDTELEAKIGRFKKRIESWLASYTQDVGEPLQWYSFASWAEHVDDEPEESPCVLIMLLDELICWLFNHDDEFFERFEEIVNRSPFYFVQEDDSTIFFYVKDPALDEAFRDYLEWRWICDLSVPDYSDLYEELFLRFAQKPDDLHRLPPRRFEYLLDAVFRNNGFETKLGPGTGDGGVDIHLYAKDAIGDIVTLVQAKRYAESRSIQLEAVAALTAHVYDQHADAGLFVTTSRFLPSAQCFAKRQSRPIILASKKDIARWSKEAAKSLVRNKASLVTDDYVRRLIAGNAGKGLEGKIVCAHVAYGYYEYYDFCIVLRETAGAVLLMSLPQRRVQGVNPKLEDTHGQYGYKIPILDASAAAYRTDDNVFRAKKKRDGEHLWFWGQRKLYSLWDGQPKFYNSMD